MEDFNAFFESEDTSESQEIAAVLTNRYLMIFLIAATIGNGSFASKVSCL
jgi:hypothetical protein